MIACSLAIITRGVERVQRFLPENRAILAESVEAELPAEQIKRME